MRVGALALVIGAVLAGCGLSVQSPDLFLLTRTGQGRTLTLLVSDSGTIRCNGGPPKSLPNQLLLQARGVASDLGKDAKAKLRIPAGPGSVARYTIRLQGGTISFPDTAASGRHELAEAELFATQSEQGPCAAR